MLFFLPLPPHFSFFLPSLGVFSLNFGVAQDRLDLADTAKHLAQRMSEPRELDFIPLRRAARYLVGKPKAALRFRRQKHVDKIKGLRG